MSPELRIHAEPPPRWSIILMAVPSLLLSLLGLLATAAPFTLFRHSEGWIRGGSWVLAAVFGGVALRSWRETLALYLRRQHPADVYIAVTDRELIYQHHDALLRLQQHRIPKHRILKVTHGVTSSVFSEEGGWQIGVQYQDARGRRRTLWIDYDELFPAAAGMSVVRALEGSERARQR